MEPPKTAPVPPETPPTPIVQTPPTPLPSQTPAPSQNPKVWWYLAGFSILVLGGTGAAFLGRQFIKPSVPPTPTPIVAAPTISTDPTANWKTYTDPQNIFSFKYPESVALNTGAKDGDDLNLYVQTKDLENYADEPLGYDLETANKDLSSLKNGQIGNLHGGITDSAKLVTFSGINGTTYTTLRLLEVCDVQFSRSMVIYKNNKQILLGLSVSKGEALAKKMPEYFTQDASNCGDRPVWKSEQTMVADLMAGKAPQPAQDWYNLFDQILSTFKFTSANSTSTISPTAASANLLSTSGWVLAENDIFSIKYPSDTFRTVPAGNSIQLQWKNNTGQLMTNSPSFLLVSGYSGGSAREWYLNYNNYYANEVTFTDKVLGSLNVVEAKPNNLNETHILISNGKYLINVLPQSADFKLVETITSTLVFK